ncbi:hypothetical protein NEILACOT_04787 [Neisseria lactamica ATCC 23970]|uniref:Uncharacterized protein n=1 Tax=Neisseria lactamica ATCC 23970 TaxID=546265 RepID=D0WB64_NEILA|nr:hypothetical protein NEILACOT_04787 [Neisseria lactamica ATCC 23970]
MKTLGLIIPFRSGLEIFVFCLLFFTNENKGASRTRPADLTLNIKDRYYVHPITRC